MLMSEVLYMLVTMGGVVLSALVGALVFVFVYVKMMGNSFNKVEYKAQSTDDVRFADVLGVDALRDAPADLL